MRRRPAEPWTQVGKQPAAISGVKEGATAVVTQTQGPVNPAESAEVRFWVERGLAILGHLAVVLDVDAPDAVIKDQKGNEHRGATATTTINRKDFGLIWNQPVEAGGVAVGDQVTIIIDLELSKKAADKTTKTN